MFKINKDENVHRFALSAIREELLERERGRAKAVIKFSSKSINELMC